MVLFGKRGEPENAKKAGDLAKWYDTEVLLRTLFHLNTLAKILIYASDSIVLLNIFKND